MEKQLDQVIDEAMSQPGVYGCLFADRFGLGLGAKGKASIESAGNITAIATAAGQLEPGSDPIITYENDSRMCIIKKSDFITGAIFKNVN